MEIRKYEKIIRDFRAELHACPEPAFQEKQTKEKILRFLLRDLYARNEAVQARPSEDRGGGIAVFSRKCKK